MTDVLVSHGSVSGSGSGEAPRRNILEKRGLYQHFHTGVLSPCSATPAGQPEAEASRCETGPLTCVDA